MVIEYEVEWDTRGDPFTSRYWDCTTHSGTVEIEFDNIELAEFLDMNATDEQLAKFFDKNILDYTSEELDEFDLETIIRELGLYDTLHDQNYDRAQDYVYENY